MYMRYGSTEFDLELAFRIRTVFQLRSNVTRLTNVYGEARFCRSRQTDRFDYRARIRVFIAVTIPLARSVIFAILRSSSPGRFPSENAIRKKLGHLATIFITFNFDDNDSRAIRKRRIE